MDFRSERVWLIWCDAGILAAILPLPPCVVHRAFCRLKGVVLTPRLFAPELATEHWTGASIALGESATHHAVNVLRRRVGDLVELFDGRGTAITARLENVEKRTAWVAPQELPRRIPQARLQLHLVQGLALGDKMDWIVEKAVELGVSRLTPWRAERCQLKLDPARAEKRLNHWRAVAVAACMQCGQNWLPQIDRVSDLKEALATSGDLLLFGSTDGQDLNNRHLKDFAWDQAQRCSLVIGPESGISDEELALLSAANGQAVRLGPRILRTETAGMSAIAAIQALAGDWRI